MVDVGKKNIKLSTILAFLIVARLSCPALSNIPFMSVAFVFIYGMLFCVSYVIEEKHISKNELLMLSAALLYMFFVTGRSLMTGRGLFSTDAFNAYILLFLTAIYLWGKKESIAVQSNMLKMIFCACIFNYIYSIVILTFDPDASRIAAATSVLEASPYDILHAVGSFDAVYGAIFVVALILLMRQNIAKSAQRILINIVLFLAIIFVVMAAYATAIIMLCLMFFIYLSSKNKVLSWLGIIITILVVIFHEPIGELIIQMAKNISYSKMISLRASEFGQMLKTFEAAGTYGGNEGRLQKMIDSIQTFFKYPILGGYGNEEAKIGGHSEFFDVLGKYGLVGFSMLSIFFASLYKEIRSNMISENNVKCLNIIFFLYIVLSILNPALYALLILPIILMLPFSKAYMAEYAMRKRLNESF